MSFRSFKIAVILLLSSFFFLQCYCVFINSVGLDEFQNLYLSQKAFHLKPYRDWIPFKTTLALYFDALFFYFTNDQWQIIHFAKLARLIFLVAVLYWSLSKFDFSKNALLTSLLLLCSNTYFLLSSNEIRPDILNALSGFVSFVFLINGNSFIAGLLVALSFCISQKGIAYYVASLFLLTIAAISKQRKWSDLLGFNAVFFTGLIFYLVYSSLGSSFLSVLINIFTKHLYLINERNYPNTYNYWLTCLYQNPFFVFCSIASYYFYFRKDRPLGVKHKQILQYVFILVFCCYLYPEPLPYYFILFLPFLFIVNLISLETFLIKYKKLTISVSLLSVFCSVFIYVKSWKSEQAYQEIMTIIGQHLLVGNEKYFAGSPFLIFNEQTPEEFSWIDMRKTKQLGRLNHEEQSYLLDKFRQTPPKFIYSSYKIDNLPKIFVDYFEQNYYHYFGNIFVYSSTFDIEKEKLKVEYSGNYSLLSESSVNILGKVIMPGQTFYLNKAEYNIDAKQDFKVILRPSLELDARYDRYRQARD